ncbi:ATP-binding protein [Aquabacterium sp.]|uniref:sensor histidine kinase n=1 Tax=Aquabacterium sp. TaxID=1872578 RepID=UPI003B6C0943
MRYLLLTVLFWLLTPLGQAAQPVLLAADFHQQALDGHLEASPRNSTLINAEEALRAYQSRQFEPLPGSLGRGYRPDVVWLAFEVTASPTWASPTVHLEIAPASLDHISIYTAAKGHAPSLVGVVGDQIQATSPHARQLTPSVEIPVVAGASQTVLVRIQTTSTQSALLSLRSPLAHHASLESQGLLSGILVTLSVVMLAMALSMGWTYRHSLFWLWAVQIFFTISGWALMDGLVYRYLDFVPSAWINRLTPAANMLSMSIGTLMMAKLFDFAAISKWWDRLFVGSAMYFALAALLSVMDLAPKVLGASLLLALPLPPIGIALTLLQMWRGHTDARLFGPSFMTYGLFTGYHLTAALGWSAFTAIGFWGWQWVGLLNLASLHVAMFKRARALQQEGRRERAALMARLKDQNRELEDKVTERTRHLEVKLKQTREHEEEQRQFIAMLSHEVRSPLAVIDAASQVLGSRVANDSPLLPPLQRIRRGVARLASFFENSLTQDRIDSHTFRLQLETIDPHALGSWIQDSADMQSADHVLTVHIAESVQPFEGDLPLLRIVLMNLVGNAMKYSPAGSTIDLDIRSADSFVQFIVRDQGDGIAADEISDIFQRYHRGRGAQGKPGAGLGLSLVRRICELHHGSISVDSQEARGSTFTLSIPRSQHPVT